MVGLIKHNELLYVHILGSQSLPHRFWSEVRVWIRWVMGWDGGQFGFMVLIFVY